MLTAPFVIIKVYIIFSSPLMFQKTIYLKKKKENEILTKTKMGSMSILKQI